MAATDSAAIASALNQRYEDELETQINRASVALQVLPVRPGVGKNVAWDARVGTSTAAAISDGATVTTFNADTKVPATLDFATYHDAFGVTGRAISMAYNSGGPAGLMNLFEEHLMESAERLASLINQELYTGTGGTGPETIAGLTSKALTLTGTYAGILRATYPQWAANVLANGGTGRDLTLQLMRDMRKAVYIASGRKPDLILCDPNQHERYGLLIGQQRRYVQEVQLRGEVIKLDGGYQVLEFDGIPVIEDKDAPAGTMLFLNTRTVAVRFLPDAVQQVMGGTAGERGVDGTEEEQEGVPQARLRARVQPLAVNGDVRNFALYCYPQLQVRRPNANGVLADLNT